MKLIILFATLWLIEAGSAKIINCYYGTWATYRPSNGKFTPANIDPHLCTHLSYSFFGITDNGEFKSLDDWLDNGLGYVSQTVALKQANPKLKLLAVVGGWNEGSTKYSAMAADAGKRSTFISSALNFIRQNGFDGLDLDWEYPTQRGGSSADRVNFVTLLKELKAALSQYGLILGIAVGAGETTASTSYDIPNIAKYVDFINVMTYDFSTAWDGILGFNAPLYGDGKNNLQASINYWLQQGAPPSKLILGIGFYGRSFQLANTQQIVPGSVSIGLGSPGPYTREGGYLGYNEICESLSTWTVVQDKKHGVPYAYKSDQWVGYDDVKSIALKMDFLKSLDLGGAMVWSIETDDFLGTCGESYPLLKTINRAIGGSGGSGGGAPSPGTTTRKPTAAPSVTTKAPTSGGNCSVDGTFADSTDCSRYFVCMGGVRYNMQCPTGLYIDSTTWNCNWPSNVNCQV